VALGALLGLAALQISACSPSVATHGHRLDPAALAQIEPGRTTRDQVLQLLGSPSSFSTFDDQAWYYVSQRTERLSFYQEDVVAQDVTAITFTDRGVVSAVDQHGLDQAQAVTPVERTTPTVGNELSVIEQLIGNIGRFNQAPADDTP
jgi:outer membrane protein assembly factor BamE (lipoprotein component of BamABCDE complex)